MFESYKESSSDQKKNLKLVAGWLKRELNQDFYTYDANADRKLSGGPIEAKKPTLKGVKVDDIGERSKGNDIGSVVGSLSSAIKESDIYLYIDSNDLSAYVDFTDKGILPKDKPKSNESFIVTKKDLGLGLPYYDFNIGRIVKTNYGGEIAKTAEKIDDMISAKIAYCANKIPDKVDSYPTYLGMHMDISELGGVSRLIGLIGKYFSVEELQKGYSQNFQGAKGVLRAELNMQKVEDLRLRALHDELLAVFAKKTNEKLHYLNQSDGYREIDMLKDFKNNLVDLFNPYPEKSEIQKNMILGQREGFGTFEKALAQYQNLVEIVSNRGEKEVKKNQEYLQTGDFFTRMLDIRLEIEKGLGFSGDEIKFENIDLNSLNYLYQKLSDKNLLNWFDSQTSEELQRPDISGLKLFYDDLVRDICNRVLEIWDRYYDKMLSLKERVKDGRSKEGFTEIEIKMLSSQYSSNMQVFLKNSLVINQLGFETIDKNEFGFRSNFEMQINNIFETETDPSKKGFIKRFSDLPENQEMLLYFYTPKNWKDNLEIILQSAEQKVVSGLFMPDYIDRVGGSFELLIKDFLVQQRQALMSCPDLGNQLNNVLKFWQKSKQGYEALFNFYKDPELVASVDEQSRKGIIKKFIQGFVNQIDELRQFSIAQGSKDTNIVTLTADFLEIFASKLDQNLYFFETQGIPYDTLKMSLKSDNPGLKVFSTNNNGLDYEKIEEILMNLSPNEDRYLSLNLAGEDGDPKLYAMWKEVRNYQGWESVIVDRKLSMVNMETFLSSLSLQERNKLLKIGGFIEDD
jgi:hypothetical protein